MLTQSGHYCYRFVVLTGLFNLLIRPDSSDERHGEFPSLSAARAAVRSFPCQSGDPRSTPVLSPIIHRCLWRGGFSTSARHAFERDTHSITTPPECGPLTYTPRGKPHRSGIAVSTCIRFVSLRHLGPRMLKTSWIFALPVQVQTESML